VKRLAELFQFSTHVSNVVAAQILGLQPQTLRRWSSHQTGPIQSTLGPSGRRMWAIADLQNVLDGKASL
jgi:hypothetical protein